MRRSYTKVFRDEDKLFEMLGLRQSGESLNFLARKYNVDHSSVLYQCKKYQVEPMGQTIIRKEEKKIVVERTRTEPEIRKENRAGELIIISSREVNMGKNYIDYVKESKERKQRRRLHNKKIVL